VDAVTLDHLIAELGTWLGGRHLSRPRLGPRSVVTFEVSADRGRRWLPTAIPRAASGDGNHLVVHFSKKRRRSHERLSHTLRLLMRLEEGTDHSGNVAQVCVPEVVLGGMITRCPS
jgi:hypothetical protein